MKTKRTSIPIAIAALLFMLMPLPTVARGQEARLGKVHFPTSTKSEKAQAHFIRGLAALHSFWFEEALEEFTESTRVDPEFAMGYWGIAMSHNYPLWAQQHTEEGRQALAKIKDDWKLSARERAFIDAVKVLYGEGDKLDKLTRDKSYASAMEKIYQQYPDDLEAASFYSLALLGTVRPGDRGFQRQMKAGAIATQVYEKNPDHPGAAHFIIHSFDDPEHAILALPAARRYAEIAPAAHHARHMPSHIFLQLGMWPEAAASNESAWAASDEWVKRKKLPITRRDYHSLHWLLYVYSQQGRQKEAEQLLQVMHQSVVESGTERMMGRPFGHEMAAAFIIETERWDQVDKVFGLITLPANAQKASSGAGQAHMHGPAPASPGSPAPPLSKVLVTFVGGLAAATTGSDAAEKNLAELQNLRKQLLDAKEPYRAKQVEIMGLEVDAVARAHKGSYDEAISLMKRATALEEEMSPPSGPPDLIKPSHELLGEILLRAGKAKEAAEQFAISLARQPNRARSLLGMARAAAKMNDANVAAESYARLLKIWEKADEPLPELREAKAYSANGNQR
jgi:tetratricopeptide (TPR) repeat protein